MKNPRLKLKLNSKNLERKWLQKLYYSSKTVGMTKIVEHIIYEEGIQPDPCKISSITSSWYKKCERVESIPRFNGILQMTFVIICRRDKSTFRAYKEEVELEVVTVSERNKSYTGHIIHAWKHIFFYRWHTINTIQDTAVSTYGQNYLLCSFTSAKILNLCKWACIYQMCM